ncbi:MAG TPA: DUF3619 family protein [Rhodocyclaceae bacterium]|jgi:hypothetical protein
MNTLLERQQELRIAHLVRQTLDGACRELPGDMTSRLEKARQLALQHQKTPVAGLRLAGMPHMLVEGLGKPLRTAMMILALFSGMAGTWYWNSMQAAEDNVDVDTELLSDDLPVAAYTDAGFRAWLEHSANTDN